MLAKVCCFFPSTALQCLLDMFGLEKVSPDNIGLLNSTYYVRCNELPGPEQINPDSKEDNKALSWPFKIAKQHRFEAVETSKHSEKKRVKPARYVVTVYSP